MSLLRNRVYQAGDESKIVELYNLITGRNRKIENHRWEWLETPEGQGSIWVICEGDDNKIVGHHGLIPLRCICGGQYFLVGKTENTILHPTYLGTGIYFLHEKQFITEAMKRFDILLTTYATGTPYKIRRKLGYKEVGYHTNYIKIIQVDKARKVILRIIDNKVSYTKYKYMMKLILYISLPFLYFYCGVGRILTKFQAKKKNIECKIVKSIEEIDNEFKLFWKNAQNTIGFTVDRNLKYMKWRIFSNPNVKYEFIQLRQNGRMVGYAILKKSTNHPEIGFIVDLIAENNQDSIFSSIINEVQQNLTKNGIGIVIFQTIISENIINKVFQKNGFISIEKVFQIGKRLLKNIKMEHSILLINFFNKAPDKDICNPANWYFTDIFSEGII